MRADIHGLQEAQEWNLNAIRALKPEGSFGTALRMITQGVHTRQVAVTHVKSGALRGSARMGLDLHRLRGRIFIEPDAVAPSGAMPVDYGEGEIARGGDHDFQGRAISESRTLIDMAAATIIRGVS